MIIIASLQVINIMMLFIAFINLALQYIMI